MTQKPFLEQLDVVNNEAEVRERLAAGNYNSKHASLAQEWLRRKEEARTSSAMHRAEAREEESLAISRKALSFSADANDISRSAKKWAIAAMIVSTISAIVIAIIQIFFGPPQ